MKTVEKYFVRDIRLFSEDSPSEDSQVVECMVCPKGCESNMAYSDFQQDSKGKVVRCDLEKKKHIY